MTLELLLPHPKMGLFYCLYFSKRRYRREPYLPPPLSPATHTLTHAQSVIQTAICQRQAELGGKPIAPLKAYPIPKAKVGMTWGLTIHV